MRIAFVITPNMLATSFTNPYELFFAAGQTATASNSVVPTEQAELVKVAPSETMAPQPSGLNLQPDEGLHKQAFDIIYLPAMWRNPRPVVRSNPELIQWLRWQYEQGAIINATGTGVWFTASTGLLDAKPATTHWYFFERFARDFPNVQLKRQHFITTAGNLYCAGSINALTDLTLHHVHRFYGRDVAEHLSHHFSHEVRQPFDELSFSSERNTNHPDELVLQIQLWMQNNLGKTNVSLAHLAGLFGMSPRNLSRRFKEATNMTPIAYLQNQRVIAAKELLQSSSLSIKEIAYRVGYLDVSYFSKLFKQLAALTPREYRSTQRAQLFNLPS